MSLALTFLRTSAGWSKSRLAQALGLADESLISAYERGAKPLTREKLDSLVEPLGHPPEAVDLFLFFYDLIFPGAQEEAASPVALSPAERRIVDRAAMAAGWTAGRIAAEAVRDELRRRKKLEQTEVARQDARELWQRLKAATRQDRRDMVSVFPEFWNWALAERVSHESEQMAAHKVEDALELAHLALAIAEQVPGEEGLRAQGYCWGHVANARRVGNDLSGADEAFVRAWDLWRAGGESD
ncbi:MAG: helix-turn-helix transcriptional regulator, partial [Acidobacteria bacterium]|nr:helix-turn-helix transcriptional regulator [Acidobacteriota bacterium]